MADKTFDAVIIGAGNKALILAMYLAKYGGMHVGLFEKRHEAGGGWTSDAGQVMRVPPLDLSPTTMLLPSVVYITYPPSGTSRNGWSSAAHSPKEKSARERSFRTTTLAS